MPRTTIIDVDTTNFPVYDTTDLNFFQRILEDILTDLGASDATAAADGDRTLKIRVAAALFRCAENGERDYDVLKRAALACVAGSGTPTH
jgi:hypothetical protein